MKHSKNVLINYVLFSTLLLCHSAYAAQYQGVDQDLSEKSFENQMLQETFKVQEEQNLPYFDMPEPGFSQQESAQQVKNNYKNTLKLVLQKRFTQASTKINSLIENNPE